MNVYEQWKFIVCIIVSINILHYTIKHNFRKPVVYNLRNIVYFRLVYNSIRWDTREYLYSIAYYQKIDNEIASL